MTALPHQLWYEADVDQIAAAEECARDEENVEGLTMLAASLQVQLLAALNGRVHSDLYAD